MLPDLPTVHEAGVPGYSVTNWFGVTVPAKTAQEIVAKLHTEIARILQTDEVSQRLSRDGLEPVIGTPAEFAALIKADIAKWAGVIKDAGIRIE